MSKINIEYRQKSAQVMVGALMYGTFLTGVRTHPNAFYVKVDPHNFGDKIDIRFCEPQYCALVNIKTGSLRAVHQDFFVTPLDTTLRVSDAVHPEEYYAK